MKTMLNMALVACIALLLSCGDGFYDAAKRAAEGYSLAAVLVDGGGTAKVIITDGRSLRRDIYVVGMSAPSAGDLVYMDRERSLFVADGYVVFVESDSGWRSNTPNPGYGVRNFINNDGETQAFLINDMLYEYREYESTPWFYLDTITPSMTIIVNSDGDGELYGLQSSLVYRIGSSTPEFDAGISAAFFLARKNGIIYCGSDSVMSTSTGGSYSVQGGIFATSYAVVNESTIFAGGYESGARYILSLGAGGFEPDYSIPATSGNVLMEYLEDTRLIVGINAATPVEYNGLYVYDFAVKSLAKISSEPVHHIHVRR